MANKNTIDRITEILQSSELSWLFPNLRQDGMIWNSLNDPIFLDKLLNTKSSEAQFQARDFSPIKLALIALDQPSSNDYEHKFGPIGVSDKLLQTAIHSFPELIQSQHGINDLSQAGLVALALAHQHQQTGSWQELIHVLPEGDLHTWLTPVTCLFGLVEEPEQILQVLVQPGANILRYILAIHAVLSNPISNQDQLKFLSGLCYGPYGDPLPPPDRIRFLDELHQQNSQVAIDFCNRWLSNHPLNTHGIESLQGNWLQLTHKLADVLYQIRVREIMNSPGDLPYLRTFHQSLSHTIYADLVRQMLVPGNSRPAEFIRQNGKVVSSGNIIEIARQILPLVDSPKIEAEMALAINRLNQSEEVLHSVLNSVEALPEHLESLYAIALLSIQVGDSQRSDNAVSKLIEVIDHIKQDDELPVWGEFFSLVNLGKLLFNLHRPADASRIYELASHRCPNDPTLLELLAECYKDSNQGQQATDTYCTLVSLQPKNVDHRREFANCLAGLDLWDACLKQRSFIIESNSAMPPSVHIQDLYEYAFAALQAKRPELALNTCKDILINNPEDIQALIYLGKAQININQIENGLQSLAQATQISPESTDAWIALADAQKEQGEVKTAISTLINATMLLPEAEQLHFSLGNLYLQDNAPTLALPELERAFELAPEEPMILVNYSQALLLLGHSEKAQQMLATAYHLEPDFPGLASMYSKVLINQGKLEEAIDPLELLVNNKLSREPETYLDYARCILSVNKLGLSTHPPMKALIALNEAMQIAPEIIEAKALTAEVLNACGENELAYQAYHDALETDLRNDKSWFERLSYGLGCTASAIGKYDVAIAALQEAGQINPSNPSVFMALSDTYLSADFPEEAVRAARNVLVIDGENADRLSWFAKQMTHFISLYPQVNRISSGNIHSQITSEILAALNKAIQLAPTRIDLLIQLGNFQSGIGSKVEAVSTFSSISSLDFATVSELIAAAENLSNLEEHQAAIHSLEKALAADLNNPEQHVQALYKKLALEYVVSHDTTSALSILDKGIDLIPTDRSLLRLKVEILLELGNPDEALACIEDTLQTIPRTSEDAGLLFLASRINRSSGNLEGAVDQARRATHIFLHPGRSLNLTDVPIRYRALIAELYRSLLQPQQAYRVIDDKQPAKRTDFETEQEYLDYLCLYTELALETGKQTQSLIQGIHLEQSHPFAIRLAALNARSLHRSGDSTQARQVLQYAASQVNLPNNKNTGWEKRYYDYEQAVTLCEAALEIGSWELGNEFIDQLVNLGQDEPLPMVFEARNIVLRAEFDDLCDTFDVVEHKAKIREQYHDPLNNCLAYLNNAQLIIDNFRQEPVVAELGLDDDQIQRWSNRAKIVFYNQSSNLLEFSENLSHLGYPEDLPALVHCYHLQSMSETDSDAMTKVIKAARAYPVNPGVILQAARALHDSSPESTMRSLQAVLNEYPSQQNSILAFCNILLLKVAESLNDPISAEQAIESALVFWPDESRWQTMAAQLYSDHKNIRGAISHMTEATKLAPEEYGYHIRLGELYLENANDDRNVLLQALKSFEIAESLEPKNVNGLIDLATTQYSLNDIESANNTARRALLISPNRSEIYQLLSVIAIRNNDYQGAYEYANKALLISPKDVQCIVVLAKSLSALGRHHEAIAKLNAAISEVQEPERLYLERVNILHKMAGVRAALTELVALNDSHPDNFEILNALSRMHAEAGEYENAVEIALQALTNSTNKTSANEQANIHLLLGQIYRKSGKLDLSIQHLDEAIRLAPDRLEPYLELGLARKERREYQQALQIFEHATNIAPDDPRAPFQAGLALKESKDYKTSETMLRRAVSLAPNDLSIRRQLAAVVALNLVHNPRVGRS